MTYYHLRYLGERVLKDHFYLCFRNTPGSVPKEHSWMEPDSQPPALSLLP